jgi:phosphomethylpyrimidine synthase
MCGPKFCSMKITADVREYAASLGDNEKAALGLQAGMSIKGSIEDGVANSAARHPEEAPAGSREARPDNQQGAVSRDEAERGMKEMSQKFKEMGSSVYLDADKVKESNKALQ